MSVVAHATSEANYIRSAVDERAVREGCYFDAGAAEHVVLFFETFLTHSRNSVTAKKGQPLILQEWQRDYLRRLFGWKRANGSRRFRVSYVEIPKKNGKTTLCAGIALYLLVADGEPAAEVFSAAAARDQAAMIFKEAKAMVMACDDLAGMVDARDSAKRLVIESTGSYYQALSADVGTKEGLNIHGLIFDELHAQPNRELWDCLRYGGAARTQPLIVSITTAGYDRHSICWEQHDYAAKVLEGVVEDTSFLPLIFAADEGDDWTAPATWRKANPCMGVTIAEDEMAEACREAQESPAKENSFKRYRLNIWTEQDVRWLSLHNWDACSAPVEPPPRAGRECFAGLDMSSVRDLTALALVFPFGGYLDVEMHFWVPGESAIERDRRDRVPYTQWIREGNCYGTPGSAVDYDAVRRKINELSKVYKFAEIGFDPWNAQQLFTQLEGDGFTMVKVGQNFAGLNAAMKDLDRRVSEKMLCHHGHPVLRWCASNVTVETDAAANLKPSKKKSTERIDGISALVTAISRAMLRPENTSVYQTRGIRTL